MGKAEGSRVRSLTAGGQLPRQLMGCQLRGKYGPCCLPRFPAPAYLQWPLLGMPGPPLPGGFCPHPPPSPPAPGEGWGQEC